MLIFFLVWPSRILKQARDAEGPSSSLECPLMWYSRKDLRWHCCRNGQHFQELTGYSQEKLFKSVSAYFYFYFFSNKYKQDIGTHRKPQKGRCAHLRTGLYSGLECRPFKRVITPKEDLCQSLKVLSALEDCCWLRPWVRIERWFLFKFWWFFLTIYMAGQMWGYNTNDTWDSSWPEEGIGTSGTGATGDCESTDMGAGNSASLKILSCFSSLLPAIFISQTFLSCTFLLKVFTFSLIVSRKLCKFLTLSSQFLSIDLQPWLLLS